jgi:hypothetical protein
LQPRGLDGWIVPDKSGFHDDLLSGVTTDLPSKKSFARSGTLLSDEKTQRLIDSAAVPAQNGHSFQLTAAFRLHPKFTIHRAKWVD